MGAMAQGPVKHIKPEAIHQMPKISVEEFENAFEELDSAEEESAEANDKIGDLMMYTDLYSGFCSWYCGGEILSVKASSSLKPQGKFNYKAENAHDFNHRSVWVEGADGQGIGEWLEYEFPGRCPRITTVKILNGHVKTPKAWRENSRVKSL